MHLGDRNTRYFHTKTMIRRKRNHIHGLHLPSGEWCTDEMTLQVEAQIFFKNLFCADSNTNSVPFVVQQVPQLSTEMAFKLTQPVTIEEVEEALSAMHPYKSPGPDGFRGVFFKYYWSIIYEDIFTLISQAFSSGYFDPSISETLIALIPKVDCPSSFKEFRLISLCNTLYKLITKVLANRIRPMLDFIISPFQSSLFLREELVIMPSFSKRLFI